MFSIEVILKLKVSGDSTAVRDHDSHGLSIAENPGNPLVPL